MLKRQASRMLRTSSKKIADAEQKITDAEADFAQKDEEFKSAVQEEDEAQTALDGDEENEELKTALNNAKTKTVDAELAVNTATQAIEVAKDEKT